MNVSDRAGETVKEQEVNAIHGEDHLPPERFGADHHFLNEVALQALKRAAVR
jgi:hypothetical protein